jgi:hypothetical protein
MIRPFVKGSNGLCHLFERGSCGILGRFSYIKGKEKLYVSCIRGFTKGSLGLVAVVSAE